MTQMRQTFPNLQQFDGIDPKNPNLNLSPQQAERMRQLAMAAGLDVETMFDVRLSAEVVEGESRKPEPQEEIDESTDEPSKKDDEEAEERANPETDAEKDERKTDDEEASKADDDDSRIRRPNDDTDDASTYTPPVPVRSDEAEQVRRIDDAIGNEIDDMMLAGKLTDEQAQAIVAFKDAIQLDQYAEFVLPNGEKVRGAKDFAGKMKDMGVDISQEMQMRLVQAAAANMGKTVTQQTDTELTLGKDGRRLEQPAGFEGDTTFGDDTRITQDLDTLRDTRRAFQDDDNVTKGPADIEKAISDMPDGPDKQVLEQSWKDLSQLSDEGSLNFDERKAIFDQTVAYLGDFREALANKSIPDSTPADVYQLLVDNQRKLAHQTVTD
ncbi:MAG: hypothetical protein HN348_35085, partial [Proteobacteria bacterium]|nr:hypothetical protein [Pseudomonadota bacterium]